MFRSDPYRGLYWDGGIPFGSSSIGYSPGSGEFGADPGALSQTTSEQWNAVPGHPNWDAGLSARQGKDVRYFEKIQIEKEMFPDWPVSLLKRPDLLAQNATGIPNSDSGYRTDAGDDAEDVLIGDTLYKRVDGRLVPYPNEEVTFVAPKESIANPPYPTPDWTTTTEWVFPAADPRLIPMVTSMDTGNRPLNFLLNKVVMPWRNALAFAENISISLQIAIDDAFRHSPFSVEYQNAPYILPMNAAVGMAFETGPALNYAQTWLLTDSRVSNFAKSFAFPFVGMTFGGFPKRTSPLGPDIPISVPIEAEENSFAGLIDVEGFSNDPVIVDRLSRARKFDIATYKSLQGSGEFGQIGDGLDSDEALQNAFLRYLYNVKRGDKMIKGNPAIALPPELHRTIEPLKNFDGLSATEVLLDHINKMRSFTPSHILIVLEREVRKFIKLLGLD